MGWVYIHIEGDPYERGYQYGYLASDEIVDMINRWSNWGHNQKILKLLPIHTDTPRYDEISEIWWEYCKLKAKKHFLKHYPEEYIQEMKGIADGIKDRRGRVHNHPVEFDDILTANEIVDCWFSYEYPKKGFNPFRRILNSISNLFSKEQTGFCSAFIATGDATTDGRIVAGHSTHVPQLYIPERFNIILDIKPTKGNRFIMTCPPGTIHSMTDYYQNEKGIVITETTYQQGPWNIKKVPITIRARRAIQYSDSIDDVVKYLKDGNNGLYACEWLIGDTKTGEIASLELALYNTPIKRTKNGFYYSCNYPHDRKVQREIYGFLSPLIRILTNLMPNTFNPRVNKFKEIKEEYYGKIDLEIAKTILATYPICEPSTDGKTTDSTLINNLGFLAFIGNPNGVEYVTTNEQKKKFKGITDLPAVGWTEIYAPKDSPDTFLRQEKNFESYKESRLLWKYESNKDKTNNKWVTDMENIISEPVFNDDLVITSSYNGDVYAFNSNTGKEIWNHKFHNSAYLSEIKENSIYIGSGETCYSFNSNNKKIIWKRETDGPITSSPMVTDRTVYVGSWDGNVYALDSNNGYIKWSFKTGWGIDSTPYVSDDTVYVGSLDNNFYAIDADNGNMKWYFTCKAAIHSSPITFGDYVFFGCDDGYFYALDRENGDLAWSFTPGYYLKNDANNYLTTAICSNPYIDDGVVYIESEGTIYALDTQTFEKNEKKLEKNKSDKSNYLILVYCFLIIIIMILIYVYSLIRRAAK